MGTDNGKVLSPPTLLGFISPPLLTLTHTFSLWGCQGCFLLCDVALGEPLVRQSTGFHQPLPPVPRRSCMLDPSLHSNNALHTHTHSLSLFARADTTVGAWAERSPIPKPRFTRTTPLHCRRPYLNRCMWSHAVQRRRAAHTNGATRLQRARNGPQRIHRLQRGTGALSLPLWGVGCLMWY
jgi:hypothetical protein